MADTPNPTTGLTPREEEIIKNTWEVIKKDIPGNGYDLFIRFFTENPSYQQNFKSFKDVPIDQLRGNKKVLAHSNNVLYQISMFVDYLDDTETLVEMLIKTAKNHHRRKITIEMFQNLGHTLVGWLKEKIGSELMNDFAINAWKKTYGVILQVIQKGFDEAAKDSS